MCPRKRSAATLAGASLSLAWLTATAFAQSAPPPAAEPRRVGAELPIAPGGLTADQAAARAVKAAPRIELASASEVSAERKADSRRRRVRSPPRAAGKLQPAL